MGDRQQPRAGSYVPPHLRNTGAGQRLSSPSETARTSADLQNGGPRLSSLIRKWADVPAQLPSSYTSPHRRNDVTGFSIHPRSRFNGIASQQDIAVEEIGCYSLHEVENGQYEVRPDRSLLRQLVVPYQMDSPTTVCFDLNEGFDLESFKEHAEVGGMWHLHAWLEQQCQDAMVAQLSSAIQIVTSKDLLTRLCKIPYDQDPQQNATGWIFGAARVGKKVILGKVQRPGVVDMCLVSQAQNEIVYTLTDYRGRRFENYMTRCTTADGARQPEGCSRFRSVARFRLKDINVLLEAGVDGEDPFSKGSSETAYTDVTIIPSKVATSLSLYRTRFFRWFLNSRFINIDTVHVGIHEDGIVHEIHHYSVADIPQLVKEKEEELGWQLWSPDVCFGFLHELLRYVMAELKEDHTSAVYEFACSRECGGKKCTCPKRCGTFTCTRIPAADAVERGHTYLPSYQHPKRHREPSSAPAETRAA